MSTPRNELLLRIETYADAKASGSQLLHQLAEKHLMAWLSEVDIVSTVEVPDELKKQVAELPEVKRRQRRSG